MSGDYKRSKFQAEQVALDFARGGFPVVIVNPTAPIGDHDFKPTPTGKIVLDFITGKMPAYIDTGLNLVDARDVALGHVLAAERGRVGERYILGCENLTLKQILGRLSKITGKKSSLGSNFPTRVAYAPGRGHDGVGRGPPGRRTVGKAARSRQDGEEEDVRDPTPKQPRENSGYASQASRCQALGGAPSSGFRQRIKTKSMFIFIAGPRRFIGLPPPRRAGHIR